MIRAHLRQRQTMPINPLSIFLGPLAIIRLVFYLPILYFVYYCVLSILYPFDLHVLHIILYLHIMQTCLCACSIYKKKSTKEKNETKSNGVYSVNKTCPAHIYHCFCSK